ncbi:L,D-transpeptidase family protein [bacterium]|nr:L,D-transpeptidase family protein [bacterium]MBU1959133.1 L,D-transpeptidase family protein [bacterium]
MNFRMFFLFILLSLSLLANDGRFAEKVIIKKSTRMLYLSSQGEIYKKYHITLGQIPEGAKEFEGDMKTPEGIYILDWRQSSPQYYKSIHISYPNVKDRAYAEENGMSAGGMIMIHGTPTNWSLSPLGDWMPMLLDWTEGCIAMSNDDMEEVWAHTTNGTPIIIIP